MIVFFILAFAYFIVMAYLNKGLEKLINPKKLVLNHYYEFSIVIPAHNEENSIEATIQTCNSLDYPKDKYEVIVVDDRSTDKTASIIKQLQELMPNLRYLRQSESVENISTKKSALQLAIENAKYEIILTIDADCILPPKLLLEYNQAYHEQVDVVAAPVKLVSTSFWRNFIQLDYYSLMAFSAAMIANKKAIICSAANFSYKKHVFFEIDGFGETIHLQSGDDDLLLQRFQVKGKQIGFIWSPLAIVESKAPNSLNQFIHQRLRWGSKAIHYPSWTHRFILWSYALFYLAILVSIIFSFFNSQIWYLSLQLVILKLIADWRVMIKSLQLYNERYLIVIYPLFSVIHIIYTVLFGISAQMFKFKWKS